MKNHISILILTLGVSIATFSQDGISFYKGTFDEAFAQAQKEKKPLFVDFYTTWCGPCRLMSKTIFTQKKVGDYFNKKIISVKVNAESPENALLVKKYKITMYPTTAFLDDSGKTISLNKGFVDADNLLSYAKIATGESISFEELYNSYKKDKKDLETQQKLLLQAPRFLNAQQGVDAKKWSVRIRKLYKNYIDAKIGDQLINAKDYMIISNLGDSYKDDGKILNFINKNIDKWKKNVGNAPCYYVIETNDQTIEDLAKKGKPSYKDYLSKIKNEYKQAYEILAYKNTTPYEKAEKYYTALFTIYKDKDVDKYMGLMTEYFNKLGEDATPNDFGKAAQDLYYSGASVSAKNHEQAIKWLEKSLKTKINVLDKINYLVMIGDSYRELKKFDTSQKYYNQAYAESLQMTKMKMMQQMVQATIMQKRAKLELLRK